VKVFEFTDSKGVRIGSAVLAMNPTEVDDEIQKWIDPVFDVLGVVGG
jgi:hypothetical protein